LRVDPSSSSQQTSLNPPRSTRQQWIWALRWAMKKPKSFRPWQPDQTTLLPPSPREWLTEDHQVYFLLDLVDELDLSEILIPAQSKDPRGEKGYDPRMMTLLLLYAYCVGTVSSCKIERACYEDLAFRVLTGARVPGIGVIPWGPQPPGPIRSLSQ